MEAVTGEPGVLLLTPVEYSPVRDREVKLTGLLELLVPVTGDPEVLLPEEETLLEGTAVPLELGPTVVKVNLVKERVPYG